MATSTAASRKENNPNRRPNKHLVEKKRRDRINYCLNELKSLVLDALHKDESKYSKLEKADILEMTVHHLKAVQRHNAMSGPNASPNKYRAGYRECAEEVSRYLTSVPGVKGEVQGRLMEHLSSTCQQQQHQQREALPSPQATPVSTLPGSLGAYNPLQNRVHTVNIATVAPMQSSEQYQVVPQIAFVMPSVQCLSTPPRSGSEAPSIVAEKEQLVMRSSDVQSTRLSPKGSYSMYLDSEYENRQSQCGKMAYSRDMKVWRPW